MQSKKLFQYIANFLYNNGIAYLKRINNPAHGYTLVEMLLAMAVGSIILAGTYSAGLMVSRQHERVSSFSQVQSTGIPALNYLIRNVRMAGYAALDTDLIPPLGEITTPITITDSGNSCCDSISVIYDTDTTTRNRYTFSVAERVAATGNFPAINALYLTIENWNGSSWVATSTANAILAEYIEDLQFTGSFNDINGNPRLVDIFMVFRSSSILPTDITYTKPAQTTGNYNYSFTDRYHRDEFSAAVFALNLE